MKLWQILSGAVVAIALVGCSGTATNQAAGDPQGAKAVNVVSGSITYRDKSALPENALVTVVLADASAPNQPAKILSQVIFPVGETQVPFVFNLPYTNGQLSEAQRIVVTGNIQLDGQTIYSNTRVNEVLTNGKKEANLVLEQFVQK